MAISIPAPVFDHVIINVAERLDEASTLYRCHGFQLFEQDRYSGTAVSFQSGFGDNGRLLPDGEQDRESYHAAKGIWQKIRTYFQL